MKNPEKKPAVVVLVPARKGNVNTIKVHREIIPVKRRADAMKYYFDLMSQPSRALYIFFKLNPKIPVTFVPVALRSGEHLQEEYKQINRFQKVPCIIDDDGWKLSESVAIFR